MRLSDLSIKNPVFTWMLMLSIMVFGLLSYMRMGISQLPDVDFPVVTVELLWEGAAPEVMETDVVDVVEDYVTGVQGVRNIISKVYQGYANVTVEFTLDRNIDDAFQDIQVKLDQARADLPENILPPIVTKVNPEDHPVLWISISSDKLSLRDLMTYVQDNLKDKFTTISGVGDISLGGFLGRNLRIWVDAERLDAYQLTVLDVINAVNQGHAELPAGRIETARNEFGVRVIGEASSVEKFGDIVIPTRANMPNFKPIYIKDVASVEDGLEDERCVARSMGKRTVGLGILKQRGANEVAVVRRCLDQLKKIKETLPPEIETRVVYNQARFSEESIHELIFMLFLSVVVTALVCWLFLGSWGATFNILFAMPVSILGTFIVVRLLGFTLNTFTVLGLTLCIGIVVDDAIIVMENIARYGERGLSKVDAARRGVKQVTFSVITTTIALIAIFLPVAFMSGVVGKFFFQFGVTISVAIAFSTLEALTFAPMRCARFLEIGERQTRIGKRVDETFKRLAELYKSALSNALTKRKKVILAASAFFFISLIFGLFLRKEFVPPQDVGFLMCRLETPVGSSITFTDEKLEELEAIITRRSEVKDYFSLVGGFSGEETNIGIVFITLKDRWHRSLSQTKLMKVLRNEFSKISDVETSLQDLSLSAFTAERGFPIEFSIEGPDWEELAAYSEEIIAKMRKSKLMTDVNTDYFTQVPEIHVKPDRDRATERGVTIDAIGTTVNALVGGEKIGKYTKDGRRYDIKIRLLSSQRDELEDISKLWVWNTRGELVQLKDVVTIEKKPRPVSITRRNRERAISIFANVSPGASQATALKEVKRIARGVLAPGYHTEFGGSSRLFEESFSELLFVLWLGIFISYMILASQFNSFIHPVSVLWSLPFSVSGALIVLFFTNQSLNIYSMIGIILLMGIVKKDAIILVDFANQARRRGEGVREALLEACPTRLRPILMTSLSTVAAAIPPALAIGPGAESRIPMAVTIIGGVMVSTFVTLFIVPCMYSILTRFERKKYISETKETSTTTFTKLEKASSVGPF